jgi:hypothetical protein
MVLSGGDGRVVIVETDRGIATGDDARRVSHIGTDPGGNLAVWLAMVMQPDGRSHVDDSFDEFGLLEARHRVVAAFEFLASQVVARLQ